MNTNKQTGEETMNESYKDKFNAQMKKAGIDSLGDLKTDAEKKAFFKAVDAAHTAKNESMTEELMSIAEETINEMKEGGKGSGPQMKPGSGTRKGSAADGGQTDDESDDYDSQMEMMKKEMMKEMSKMPEMKMLKAETDPTKVEMMKKEMAEMMMKAMKMPEMAEMSETMKNEMMDEMMKKMNEYGDMNAMKNEMKEPMNAMMMKAMKMPIRKTEDLVGGQKKLDKDKDGDLDAKDFAMLRKTKSEAVKTGEADAEPKVKELNAMVKNPMNAMKDPMNAMKDMKAGYMKSNVKAAVKDNGGADMAVVKDAPKMVAAMAKISNEKKMMNMKAMYGESRENAKRYLDTKPGSVEEAVLISRGLIEKKKSITEARYEIEGRVSYKGVGPEDAFHMIINANSESDAEDKADDELRKARDRRKIGPGGGGNIDYMEVEGIEKTNKSLSAPETYYPGN